MNDQDLSPELQAIATHQEHAQSVRRAAEQLRDIFRDRETPASVETVALTALEPRGRLEEGIAAFSVAIYNPSPSIVYMGYAGGSPDPTARPWSFPPGSAIVLPIVAEDLEFAAEADKLADGDVVFFVLRFKTVQPFFFGAL